MKTQKLILLGLYFLLSLYSNAEAGNSPANMVNGATDLTAPASFIGTTSTTADITFTNIAYSPTAFTLNSSESYGTLDDLTSTALTVNNTSGAAVTLTLNPGLNHTSGASLSDFIYVTSGASLSIGTASTSALNFALTNTGNFDNAGTLTFGSGNTITVPIATNLVFTGAGTTIVNSVIASPGSGRLVINDAGGTVTLAAANTYGGNTTVSAGTLDVTGSILNTSTATVNGGTFNLSGTLAQSVVINGGTFAETSTGVIGSGARTFTVNGGSVTLAGTSNTYSGATTIDGGSMLTLTGSINSSSALVLGSTTLGGGELTYNRGGTHTQTFANTTLNAGASIVNDPVSTDTVALGAITRNVGSTVDFSPSNIGIVNTTTANMNSSGGQQTILGGYATYNGDSTWAVSGSGATAGNITGLAAGSYSSSFTATKDVDAAIGTSSPGSMTINSLRFNNAGTYAVNLGGALTIVTGGILETTSVGANAAAINNSTITSGNGTDLIVTQNNTGGALTIGSQITGGIGLTKSGAGSLILSATNTYTGPMTVNGGSLLFAASGSSNSTSSVSVGAGATLGTVAGNAHSVTLFTNAPSLALTLGASSLTQSNLQLNLYAAGVSDTINAGVLALNGAGSILATLNDTTGNNLSGTYTLLTWAGGTSLTSAEVSFSGSAVGEGSLSVSGNELIFTAAAAPETSSWPMLVGLALLIAYSGTRNGSMSQYMRRPWVTYFCTNARTLATSA